MVSAAMGRAEAAADLASPAAERIRAPGVVLRPVRSAALGSVSAVVRLEWPAVQVRAVLQGRAKAKTSSVTTTPAWPAVRLGALAAQAVSAGAQAAATTIPASANPCPAARAEAPAKLGDARPAAVFPRLAVRTAATTGCSARAEPVSLAAVRARPAVHLVPQPPPARPGWFAAEPTTCVSGAARSAMSVVPVALPAAKAAARQADALPSGLPAAQPVWMPGSLTRRWEETAARKTPAPGVAQGA
jgi:hypothetical protein